MMSEYARTSTPSYELRRAQSLLHAALAAVTIASNIIVPRSKNTHNVRLRGRLMYGEQRCAKITRAINPASIRSPDNTALKNQLAERPEMRCNPAQNAIATRPHAHTVDL